MIDLRRLRVLRALAEHGTVTETAAALHLTSSAVSQQLRQLSRELGVELLRPDGRRVRLTPAAHILLRHAETLHAQWEEARAELAADAGRLTGTFRLCGVSSAVAGLVAPAVTRLRRAHPGLGTEIREEESGDCFRLLLAEETDVAVVLPGAGVPPVTDPRFEQRPLLDDRQDLLVPEGHRLARAGAADGGVPLAGAAAEPWIVKRRHNDTFTLLAAVCAAAGFTPRVAHEAKEWFAVSALVAEGLGVCLVPRMVPLPAAHAVVRVPVTGEPVPVRRIVAGLRRGTAGHPAVAAGLAALGEAAEAF